MVSQSSSTPLTWANIIVTLAFAMTIAAAGWTLFQSQFSALTRVIQDNKETSEKTDVQLRQMLDRRIDTLNADVHFLRDQLIERRQQTLSQEEFKQFSAAIERNNQVIGRQLQILEQTRPTTGELQAANKNAQETAARLEERVRALEQYLLGQSKIFQTKPP